MPRHRGRIATLAVGLLLLSAAPRTRSQTLYQAAACPAPASPSAEFTPDHMSNTFEQQILDFLNAGGSIDRLASAIRALAIPFRSVEQEYLVVRLDLLQADLNGDGVEEVALTLAFNGFYGGNYFDAPTHGLVLACEGGTYRRLGLYPFHDLAGPADLTGDGLDELVFVRSRSGVGAGVKMLQMNDGDLVELAIERPREFGYRFSAAVDISLSTSLDELLLRDVDADDRVELVFTRAVPRLTIGELTISGPLRDRREIWGWDGSAVVLERWDNDPPEYRFQAAYDGDDLTLFGDLSGALASYRRVVNAASLKPFELFRTPDTVLQRFDLPIPAPDPPERRRLSAYAQYRIVLIHALRGDSAAAESEMKSLQEAYPEGDPGAPYAELAVSFWEGMLETGEVAAACKEAVNFALHHANEVLIPLGSSTYGYLNRDYRPIDICPIAGDDQ